MKHKFSKEQILEQRTPVDPFLIPGCRYIKILGSLNDNEYHFRGLDRCMNRVGDISYTATILYIDRWFKLEVPLTMESIYNLRKTV